MTRCDEVRMALLDGAGSLGTGDRDHLEGCAGCRAYAARDEVVRQLLALKRYERPDAFAVTRAVARLRERIAAEAAEPPDWIPLPVLRYAVAALFLGMVGLHFLRQPPQVPVAAGRPAAAPVAVGATPVTPEAALAGWPGLPEAGLRTAVYVPAARPTNAGPARVPPAGPRPVFVGYQP